MNVLHELAVFSQIVHIDDTLEGDNALAIGMAAQGFPNEQRHRAIVRAALRLVAAILRILFAVFAVQLLNVVVLLAVGGLLLLWVSWKMYEEIRHIQRMREQKVGDAGDSPGSENQAVVAPRTQKHLVTAVVQIAIADISMSLDNVLAVACGRRA